jgi:hypothetical protein
VSEVQAGNLNVIVNGTLMSSNDLYPVTSSDLPSTVNSVVSGDYATLTLNNSGNLNSDFSVSITYDNLPSGKTNEDRLAFNYLMVGLYDDDNNEWVSFGGNYYVAITSLTPSATDVYPILRSTVNAGTSKQYRVYIWLKSDTPIGQIGKLAYLKLDVKSATVAES